MSKRSKVEVTEKPEVTLVSIQAVYNPQFKKIQVVTQDIITKHTDFLYNIGGAQIGEESFCKPYLASNAILAPVVATVAYKADQDKAINNIKQYFTKELYVDLNNKAVDLEEILEAIDNKVYDVMDIEEFQKSTKQG